jgi:hypothetical protein
MKIWPVFLSVGWSVRLKKEEKGRHKGQSGVFWNMCIFDEGVPTDTKFGSIVCLMDFTKCAKDHDNIYNGFCRIEVSAPSYFRLAIKSSTRYCRTVMSHKTDFCNLVISSLSWLKDPWTWHQIIFELAVGTHNTVGTHEILSHERPAGSASPGVPRHVHFSQFRI